MAKALFASDLHASSSHWPAFLRLAGETGAEILIVGGDILREEYDCSTPGIPRAQLAFLRNRVLPAVRDFLADHPGSRLYLDLGNDDALYVRRTLERLQDERIGLIHNRFIRLDESLGLLGYMCVPLTPWGMKDWDRLDGIAPPEAKARWNGFVTSKDIMKEVTLDESIGTIADELAEMEPQIEGSFILVSHCPPAESDIAGPGGHPGASMAIRRFIEKWGPKGLVASFHGHIHEGPFISGCYKQLIGPTLCVLPGQQDHTLWAATFDTKDVQSTLQRVSVPL